MNNMKRIIVTLICTVLLCTLLAPVSVMAATTYTDRPSGCVTAPVVASRQSERGIAPMDVSLYVSRDTLPVSRRIRYG